MRKKKVLGRGFAAAVSCAMLVTSITMGTYAAGENMEEMPQPKFYFDMESLEGNQIVNQVTGTAYDVGGDAAEKVPSIGDYGNALKFNGSNYVDLGTEFQPENAYTMTGWIRQDAGATDGQAVFARGWSGVVSDQLDILIKNERVYHMASLKNGETNTNYQELSAASVPEERWNHVAVTRDGKNLTLFVNGEKVLEKNNFPDNGFATASKNMYVGMDCNGAGVLSANHAFQGYMDELRLYDTALSEEQIAELAYVEPLYTISDLSNGEVKVKFSESLSQEPLQEDFQLLFDLNGKMIDVEITGFQYVEDENSVVFSFAPIQNYQTVEKILQVNVAYQDFSVDGEIIIPAGDNQAPTVSDLKINNLSPKLGAEPHVKGMLEVEYTFDDVDNDAEGETKYQWYASDEKDGKYEKLQGINTKTIILLDQYIGKYLKCEVIPSDIHGNKGESVISVSTTEPVLDTEGNPLTDWLVEGGYGISHHFLANYFNEPDVYREEREKWDIANVSWHDFVSQFDVEKYAKQISEVGVKFVTLTLGQNNGYYCAPSSTYDKYLQEAGLLKEGEVNPKTVTEEFDLPMLLADELAKYDIKLMLYLPANPPHSAHWNTEGSSGYGFIGTDYKITTDVFDYTPATDGVPSQKARKVVQEMVREWSERYGDKIAGWWFDGVFAGALLEGHTDMSLEYNIAGLANAAKAGNPYSIVTFNPGGRRFEKTNDYQDYTAGEQAPLSPLPETKGRWATGTDDCQNYTFGVLGSMDSWKYGWGCKGTSKTTDELIKKVKAGLEQECAMGLDVRVNVFGEIDPDQYAQLKALNLALENEDSEVTDIKLDKDKVVLEAVGDRELLKATLEPLGVSTDKLNIYVKNEEIAEVRESVTGVYDIVALKEGETSIIFESKADPSIKAECKITVNGRQAKEIVDDFSENIVYSQDGKWYATGGRPADQDGFYEYKQTVHASNVKGATAEFTFEGTGFDIIGGVNTDQGKISIKVDNQEPVVVDTSVPGGGSKKAFALNLYKNYELEPGIHQVVLTNLEEKYMIVDGFRVYDEKSEEVSKNTLEYFLNKAKDHVANGDTEGLVESVQKLFEEAIAEGEAVMADENATKEDVTNATMKLMKAIHALEMKAGDKTDLEMALELANGLDLTKYVEVGQAEFNTAKETANAVMANGDAMQQEVNDAWNALLEAMSNLRLKADKSVLEELLNSVKDLDLSQYTEETVAVYKAAFANANEVMKDETLSEDDQQAVDDAVKTLADARDGLKLKDDGNSEDTDNGNNNSNNNGNNNGTTDDKENNNQKPATDKNAPKTGDAADMVMPILMIVLASGMIIVMKKKREVK